MNWSRQAHVLLGLVLLGKLLWFDNQVEVGLVRFFVWVATLGTAILLVCWLPLLRPRARLAAIFMIDFAVSGIILVDLLYYRFFSTLVSVSLLPQAGQTDEVVASIAELFTWRDLWLFVDIACLAVLIAIRRTGPILAPAGQFRSRRSRELVGFAAIGSVTILGFPFAAIATSPAPFSVPWDMMAYRMTGLAGFHVYDIARFANDTWATDEPTQQELEQVSERLAQVRNQPDVIGSPAQGSFRDKSVLMVQVESLEASVLGRSYQGAEITPRLNELVSSSVIFRNAYHQVGAGHTADAEWLTGCSLYPALRGTAFLQYDDNELGCLPEMLRQLGYGTAAHHANDSRFWNRQRIYPAVGYADFFSREDFDGAALGSWGIGDGDFLKQTTMRLASGGQPRYDLAITLTSHHPYSASLLEDSPRVAGDLSGSILGNYLDSVAYVDDALGRLIDDLKRTGLWDKTIVVIYGDHDSGIPDRDLWEQFAGRGLSDYELAVQKLTVPLIVHLPGDVSAGLEVTQPVGQLDVAPLLARLLGIDPQQTRHFLGTDPMTVRDTPVVFRNGGFVSSEHLLVSPSGPCFDRSAGVEIGIDSCAREAVVGAAELAVSDSINNHDLLAIPPP